MLIASDNNNSCVRLTLEKSLMVFQLFNRSIENNSKYLDFRSQFRMFDVVMVPLKFDR